MRKTFLLLAVAAAVAGCSTKQAAPSNPPASASPAASSGTATNAPAGQNNPSGAVTTPAPGTSAGGPGVQNPSPSPIPTPPAGAASTPVITKEQFDKIQGSPTFDEIQKTIGLGKLIKQTERQAIYQYVGKNGGTAELTFYNGVLSSKSEVDLK